MTKLEELDKLRSEYFNKFGTIFSPDWVEKRPQPQASAQGGGPGKNKGACMCNHLPTASQALFEYFLSKGKE